MKTDFDTFINRSNTNCTKYDGLERVFGVKNALPLWVADMDFATPKFVLDAINEKLSQQILGYEEISDDWFNAIIGWQKRNGLNICSSKIAYSPGVVVSLALCVEAFSEIGDEIIVQPPVYYPFFSVIKDNGRKIIENNLIEKAGKYYIDFDDLKSKITNKTKMIFLCSPHNPIGRIWSPEELNELGQIASKFGIKIISDEIHSDLVFEPFCSMAKFDQFQDLVMILNSPSKTFNLAGISSSYVISNNKKMLNDFKKVQKAKGLHANSFSYISTIAAYQNGSDWLANLLNYLTDNFHAVDDFFSENLPQINAKQPNATYLMWLDFKQTKLNNSQIVDILLNDAKVALNDGRTFGQNGEGFMRMNVALQRSRLIEGLDKIATSLKFKI